MAIVNQKFPFSIFIGVPYRGVLPPGNDCVLIGWLKGPWARGITNVIEFRNEQWWRKEVMQQLKTNNIAFCGVSYPKLPDDAVINTPTPYYRFHGVPKLFYSEYPKAFIRNIFTQLNEKRSAKTIYVYFNNTATQAALNNARYLQSLVKK